MQRNVTYSEIKTFTMRDAFNIIHTPDEVKKQYESNGNGSTTVTTIDGEKIDHMNTHMDNHKKLMGDPRYKNKIFGS